LEAKATGEHKDLELPASVGGPLAEQVKAYANLKRTEPSGMVGGVVDWKGQKLSLASEDLQNGKKMFTVQFLGNPDPNQWKSKVKTAFQEIQQEKVRLTDFEKIYVEEVLDSCQHKPSRAADTLGISRGKLNTLMKDLEIEL
jgi:DNA-binding NtrC family response regulator